MANDRLSPQDDNRLLTMANKRQKIGTSTGPFLLTVDYDVPLELVAAGNYDYVSPDITEEHWVGHAGQRPASRSAAGLTLVVADLPTGSQQHHIVRIMAGPDADLVAVGIDRHSRLAGA